MKAGRILEKCFREKAFGIALAICCFVLFFSCFLTDSMQENRNYVRRTIYGFHNGVAFDITPTAEERFKDHLSIQSYGIMNIGGTVLSNDGTTAYGYIGSVDNSFKQLEQLQFKEGNYPQNDTEIAMEFALMDLLHVPYQIGSPVTLTILHEDGTSETKEYVLCGILDSYTTNWKSNGYPLCGAFTYNSSLVEQTHLFFIGDYPDSNAMEELSNLLDTKDSDVLFNDYAYLEQEGFSLENMAEDGGLIIGMIAFSILFLVFVEITSYHKAQYRMRVLRALGMDRKSLRSLQYKETLKQWVFITVCSIVISTIISLVLLFFFDHLLKFRLTPLPYLLSIVVPLPVVLLAKTIQLSILFRIGIIDDQQKTMPQQKIRERKSCDVFDQKALLHIVHKRNRKTNIVQWCTVVVSSVSLFFCLYSIGFDVKYYRSQVSEIPADYGWYSGSPFPGLGKEEIKEIEECWGIEEVLYCSELNAFLRYDGFENSTYALAYNYQTYNPNGIDIQVISLPEDSPIYDDFSQYIQDPSAFKEGKIVLCHLSAFTSNYLEDGTPSLFFPGEDSLKTINQDTIYYPDVQDGSEVELYYDEKTFETTVQLIPEVKNNSKYSVLNEGLSFKSVILVSEDFYNRILDKENSLYNMVIAYGNDAMSYETTDKIMSAITTNQTIHFENVRLNKETKWKQMMNHCTILGVIAVLVCISATVIIYRSRILFFEKERNRITLLKNLGTDRKLLRKLYHANQMYLLFPVIFVIGALLLVSSFVSRYYSVIRLSDLSDLIRLSLIVGLQNFPIMFLLAVYLLYCTILFIIFKKTMK